MGSPRELLDRLELFGTRLGLETTRRLLASLREPQSELAIVLVAGTNGKGSTAALLSAIGSAAGYRTGLYTSPHLESVRERIRVDGVAISAADLSSALSDVLAAAQRVGEEPPTYFEALTVAALVHFARAGVELAVLEVGLGGRLDATNATEPALSLVTEIALDHREHLGASVGEIAAEKAGILRAATPALAWVTDPVARRRLVEIADDLGTPLRFVVDECALARRGGRQVELVTAGATHHLEPALLGAHQLPNLGLAVAAAEALHAAGWERLGKDAVREGIAGGRWPGRLEWVELGAAGRVLLDGAHNPHAAAALARYLSTLEPGYTLIFGALQDKEVAAMLPPLAERAERLLLTTLRSTRSLEPEELARHLPGRSVGLYRTAGAALTDALEMAAPVVVCGSLYLVGEIRSELRRRFGTPVAAVELRTYEPARRSRP